MSEIDEDVTGLDSDVNFLFGEQIIQDERLLNLETTSNGVTIELAEINDEIEGCFLTVPCISLHLLFYYPNAELCVIPSSSLYIHISGLEGITVALDFRVTTLEENTGDGGNSSIAELEVRVEVLEETSTNQESRLTTAEENIQGDTIESFHTHFLCEFPRAQYFIL